MINDFEHFMEQFKKAITMIDKKYISISMYELPDKRYRERVYCYELYHQLRKLLGDDYQYNLDGELDKKAHPIFKKYKIEKIPDFIIHYRRDMDYNLAIIEVKPIKSVYESLSNLKDDLDKIIDFIKIAKYRYGIMLIYSNGFDDINDIIVETFKEIPQEFPENIFLIWHPGPYIEPEIIM